MNWRKLLMPFAVIWWIITQLRNLFYNKGIFPSSKFAKTIVIGNLSLGGTGKSPHAIYVLELLYKKFDVAVLSRGYGRETNGFIVANYDSNVQQIGDEPMQFFNRFKNRIIVSVGEDRVAALKKLFNKFQLDVVVLDDAFQHRKLEGGYNILLTSYHQLYSKDYVLPVGNLRESRYNASRAHIIIVTKCPANLTEDIKIKIKKELRVNPQQHMFFSQIVYDTVIRARSDQFPIQDFYQHNILLITGIADEIPFVKFCEANFKAVTHLKYTDHYNFKPEDINQIKDVFNQMDEPKIILTTEKDYMRLKQEYALMDDLYYLPISIAIDDPIKFNNLIVDYVTKNKGSDNVS